MNSLRFAWLIGVLICGPGAAATLANDGPVGARSYKYDFGDPNVGSVDGYRRVGPERVYSEAEGFGFIPSESGDERGARARGAVKDRRLDTFAYDDGGTAFLQDLPDGEYVVSLASGDADYPSETTIKVNGATLLPGTNTQKGQFAVVRGHKVRIRGGQLRIDIGGKGQFCYLEIVPASGAKQASVKESEGATETVQLIQADPVRRPGDAANTSTWICIHPWHFPPNGIWIYPQFPNAMKAGPEEVKYGWALCLQLRDQGSDAPQGYAARVDLIERDESLSPARSRTVFKNRRIPLHLHRVWMSRPGGHHVLEATPTLVAPFQETLKRSNTVVYDLSVHVVDPAGKLVKSHQISFVNRPTYLITQAQLKYRGLDQNGRTKINIGDLTGDGECEFLFGADSNYKAAYDLSGKMLWNDEDPQPIKVYNSMATRVYDIDGDGQCEVVCLRDRKLCILDGDTGEVRKSTDWPLISGRPTGLEARIFFANLTGNGVRDILVQNGYAAHHDVRITALTPDLKVLWERSDFFEDGAVGMHNLNVADIDDDGRDEVAFGTTMLDHDGKLLWRLPYSPLFDKGGGNRDHVDEAEIDDMDGDGKLEIFFASGTLLDALTGKPYFSHLPGINNGQWLRFLKVRDDLPGKQLALSNKWSPPGLFDKTGKQLEWPFPFAGWDIHDWDGDGRTEIMGGGLVVDRRGRVIGAYEPAWTMPQFCDVTGNGRQEAMPWCLDMHRQYLRVFSSAPRPEKRTHKLVVPRRIYNYRD